MKLHPWVAVILIIVGAGVASGQVATGTPTFGSFGGGPFDTVNLGNLNVHISVPILNKPGRGTAFRYNLAYDSSLWTPVVVSGSTVWQPAPSWGWQGQTEILMGYVTYSTTANRCYDPDFGWQTGTTYTWSGYRDPYGVNHRFILRTSDNPLVGQDNCVPNILSGSAAARDGSGYTINASDGSAGTTTITTPNGVVITPPLNTQNGAASFTDQNGNQISVNNSNQFFDTLSSTTPVLTVSGAGTPASPTKYMYTAPSGGTATYNVYYTQYTVQTHFAFSGIVEYGPLSNALASSITLPDGSSYAFNYEATPGSCTPLAGTANCVTGRIASITLPTGGTITYAYTGGTNSTGIYSDGSAAGLNRWLNPGGEWQYSRSIVTGTPGPGSTWTTTLFDPNGNKTVINFAEDGYTTSPTYNFYETQRQVNQLINGTQTLLAMSTRCYNTNYANCSTAGVSSPITQTDVYSQLPNGKTRLSEVLYNSSGLVTFDNEYDYGVTLGAAPSSTYLVRGTVINYQTLGTFIIKPPSVVVYDWSSGTHVTVASSSYNYDEGGVTGTTGTPQHIPITGSRGNLTTVSTKVNGTTTLSRTLTYYDTGNPYVATDVNNGQTTYVYGSGSCGNSFPTSINEPLNLSRSITWNCTGGVATSVTDENGKTATVDYSTDHNFWRPDYILDPLNNKTTYAYYTVPTAVEGTLSFNNGSSVSDIRVTLDGLGRSILTQQAQTPSLSEYDSSETDYNIVGQPSRSTVPFQAGAGVTNSTTPGITTVYDALGRPTTATDGGGGTVSYKYIQNDVLQTVGPNQNFQKQLEYDGLGRLTSVCEVTAGTGAWLGGNCAQTNPLTGYWTQYSYDALGRLLTVKQNSQASSNTQSRTYTYDWLGRLTSETNPETGHNGTAGTVNYTYDVACGGSYLASAGDLTKRVDNAGNTTCYGYDALHRLKDAGNSGPTCRHFRYDAQTPPTGVAVSTTLARMAEAYTDNCSSAKLTDEWFGYDAAGNLTDFYESTPHSGGYYHSLVASYWANGVLSSLAVKNSSGSSIFPTISYGTAGAGLDGEGRILKVNAASGTNPVSGITYSSTTTTTALPGSLTGVTFPSGDGDSFAYDPNTGRPASYQFSVHGNNDQGTLTWNPNGTLAKLVIADHLPNTTDTQTCNYLYDDLRRIGLTPGLNSPPTYAANCGTAWQQNFTYDPFGNITKSGSATFLPTYSTATNQFTISGATVTYDANGNMLSDNLNNTYTWDLNWGNPASINSTNLIYDALGQMVEQQNGSTYTQMLYSQIGKTAIMNGQALSKAFVTLPGGETAIYNSTGLAYYRHADWLGSSRVTSTAATPTSMYSDSAYAPFGEWYAPSGTADASFTGQNADTTSTLYDFTFREHSPSQGRWISPDPAGTAAADPANPQSWNRFAYVANRPLDSVDPLGLCIVDGVEYQSTDFVCGWLGGSGGGTSGSGGSGTAVYVWVPVPGQDSEVMALCCDDNGDIMWTMSVTVGGYWMMYVIPPGSSAAESVGAANNGPTISAAPPLPWYKNTCITSALGAGALSAGIDAIGLIPEAGGLARMIGHGAGYVGVVADQTGAGVIKAFGGSTGAVNGLAGLGDTSAEGLVSTGLTVAGFIPGLGQAAAVGSLGVDVYKTVRAIGQCH